jgi:hypothetical protein
MFRSLAERKPCDSPASGITLSSEAGEAAASKDSIEEVRFARRSGYLFLLIEIFNRPAQSSNEPQATTRRHSRFPLWRTRQLLELPV